MTFDAHRQLSFPLRLDWGPSGAEAIRPGCDVAVVIDVLSFTTTLSVAADRGTTVFPYRWRDASARVFAEEHDATLAVGRSQAGVSLSPSTIRAAADLPRLVLPSPNGSTISALLADSGSTVIGMGLRNRGAVAEALLRRRRVDPTLRVAVIPAGERWPDGTLRPAVEDLWGAGALVDSLVAGGWTGHSPEAGAARAAWGAVADDVRTALVDCASGRELVDIGFPGDVEIAAELDRSGSVPVLVDGAFRPEPQQRQP